MHHKEQAVDQIMKKHSHQPKTAFKNTLIKCLPLLLIASAMVIGTASASFIIHSENNTAPKTRDICLIAGPDSTSNPTTYPAATVTIAPTNDSATITLSLFPSAAYTPQPATYYTNLLEVTNTGATNYTINSITISGITGTSNLGSLSIYYYAIQTDDPQNGSPIGSATLSSTSAGTISVVHSYTIAANTTNYVEIVGYADKNAAVGSTIGFTLEVQ